MMTTKILTVAALVLLSACVQSQNLVDTKCRTDRPIFQNFDVQKYLGKWFEIYRYEQRFSKDCNCVNAIYTLNDDGSVKVNNCCHKESGAFCNEGKAILSKPEAKEGKLNVAFFGAPLLESNYWILDTDYDNFSIVYLCNDLPENKSKEAFWLLSRTAILNPEIKDKAEKLVDQYFDRKSPVYIVGKQDNETCGARKWLEAS